jgi:hypothetical protein
MISPDYGICGIAVTWIKSFIIWPDYIGEFIHSVNNELITLLIKLTFIAIGRVN